MADHETFMVGLDAQSVSVPPEKDRIMTKHLPKVDLAALQARVVPSAVIGTPQNGPRGYVGTPQNGDVSPEQINQLFGDVKQQLTRIGDEVKQTAETALNKADSVESRFNDLEQMVAGQGSVTAGMGRGGARSWGEQVVNADGFNALKSNPDAKHRFQIQNAITTATGSGGSLIQPDVRTDPVQMPRRRLRIRDLLNQGRTGANMVEYAAQVTRDNQASMVSEGTTKPESNYAWERREVAVRTLAHWIPVSRQAMDDAGVLQSVIDGELRYGLELIEENQLLSGDGTGENLAGLLTEATAFSAPFSSSGDTDLDVLLQAIAQLQDAEIEPDGLVLNPVDWAMLQSLKDDQGRYLGGGPFEAAAEALWRLPVVPSNSMNRGEFLTGAFARAATIFDRMDAEVLISSEHSDYFIKNMLAVRAEKRLALAITLPSALVTGELSTASSGS